MTVFSIVSQTPAWVWVVLIGLVWFGLGRTQEREVNPRGLVLLALVLAGLSLSSLSGTGQPLATFAGLGIGGLFGIAAGIALERHNPPLPIGNGRLRLKGEWTSLAVVLVVFVTHYVRSVVAATDPALAVTDGFVLAAAGLSGFFAIMLLTRTLLRLRIALASAAA